MPFTLGPVTEITLTFEDRDLNKAHATFCLEIADTVTILDIIGYATGLLAKVAPLTECNILDSSVHMTLKQTDAWALPPESAEVQRKGSFSFLTAAGTTGALEIPGLVNTLVVDRSNTIDISNAAITDFTNYIVNGPIGFGNGFVTGAGIQYTQFRSARKIHRSSSKG